MIPANYNEFAHNVQTIADTVLYAIDPCDALATTVYCGTLFVECNANAAAKIETALIETLDRGVRVSKVGHEFAFDFV
jgi:hypothetical protein